MSKKSNHTIIDCKGDNMKAIKGKVVHDGMFEIVRPINYGDQGVIYEVKNLKDEENPTCMKVV